MKIIKQKTKFLILILALLSFCKVCNIPLIGQICLHTPKCFLESCCYGGNGSVITPFQIWSREHLEELADSVNSAGVFPWSPGNYYILMNNITDTVRTVIGDGTTVGRSFVGSFDGQGFKIVLGINRPEGGALFGSVGSVLLSKRINITIENLTVEGYVTGARSMGVVGSVMSDDTVRLNNLVNKAKLTALSGSAAGILGGVEYGIIILTNSKNYGEILSIEGTPPRLVHVGGIVGSISGGYVINNVNYGNIYNTGSFSHYVGGVVGLVRAGLVTMVVDNISIGSIISHSPAATVGGIIGFAGAASISTLIVSNNINYGFVSNSSGRRIGGIVGNLNGTGYYSNNFNSSVVRGLEFGCFGTRSVNAPAIIENNHYDKQMCGEEK